MADREIRLIGSFQDDITPKLNRLNRQLLGTLKQFEKLQGKIAPVATEMARFNSAAAATSGNLKNQRNAIEENIRMLRQYRTELGKTVSAQTRMGAIRPPRGGGGGRPPGGGGGGITPAPIPRGRGGGGRGGGGFDGGGGGIGAGVLGVTLGTQLGSMMTNAIIAGFQTGTQIMMAPFRFGAQAIGERIRDEMSDVRTAGGLFAISKRMKTPIFSSFPEAEAYTKDQNRYLAKLAGALPGDTQEYIQVSKQISDGIFTVVSQDAANAQKLAKQLAATRGASAQEIAKLSGTGTTAMQQTGKELVGEMTKLTVLAGLGGRQGAYGLPQLTERMIAEDQISMGMFQRYAAIFRDPMIKGALERNISNINATGKNTAARLDALRKTFEEIVTPELVRRYQRTTAGVLEALKTAFLNPEVGLLGLGRPLGKAVTKFDEFGRAVGEVGGKMVPLVNTFEKNGQLYGYQIDKAGKVFGTAVRAATDQISIFDSLRDVFANIMIVLQPIIDNIALIFDPLAKLGGVLSGFRDVTMAFQSSFERYREALVSYSKTITDEATRLKFQGTIPLRASLQAINNAMSQFGGYGEDLGVARKEFARVSAILKNPKTSIEQMGEVLRKMIDQFLSSDFAKRVGAAIGTVVGTVVAQVGDMMKAAAGLATGGKLAQGFGEGFRAAGGPQGFADIIRSVFHLFGKLLIEVVKAAPLESAIAAALFFLPGAIAGLISQALSGGFATALAGGGVKGALSATKAKGSAAILGARNFITQGPKGAGPGITKMGAGTGLGRIPAMASGIPKNFMAGLKAIGPKLLGLGGIISGVIALLEGKSILEAIATGLGSAGGAAIGAAIGTVIFPGVGTAIGAAIGGWVGTLEIVTQPLTAALGGLFGAIEPLGGIIGQLWNDVTGVINGIITWGMNLIGLGDKLGEGFNLLQFALFALLSPFKLLQIGIMGIYEAYLEVKRRIFGLSDEEKAAYNRTVAGRQRAADEFTIEGRQASGFSLQQQRAAEYRKFQAAKTAGNTAEMNRITQYLRVIDSMIAGGSKPAPAPAIAGGSKPAPAPAAPAYRGGQRSAGGGSGAAAKTGGIPPTANPVPALQALNVKQSGANALLNQVKLAAAQTKAQVGASSNAQQARIREVTAAVNRLNAKLAAGMPVKVVNQPTVKFAMGGSFARGGIGNFPKTSGFGMRWGKMHAGNDYAMPEGTKLGIGGPGKILDAGYRGGYGNMVDVGGPGGMVYRFAHLSKIMAPVGAVLPPGGVFGLSGNTGNSTGPHLHFEARPMGGAAVPPDAFANIIRANWAGSPFGPLVESMSTEMKKMPYGSQLAVANSDEIFMKPKQMANVIEGATRAGAEGVGNIQTGPITISIDGYNQDPKQLTETIATELIAAMYRKSRSEVLTS